MMAKTLIPTTDLKNQTTFNGNQMYQAQFPLWFKKNQCIQMNGAVRHITVTVTKKLLLI